MRNWWRWLAISAVVVALDQIAKQWVVHAFVQGEVLPVMAYFNLTLAYNSGAAFSFLADAGGWQRVFFTAIAGIASVVIIHLLRKHPQQTLFCVALSLILGGALGNLWDRLAIGQVVDFLDFYVNNHHWPAFNVADSAITAGATLLILDGLKNKSD
ncbi:MAG: signal peptidase II [Sulfuricellaceae bacterium]